MSNAVGAEKLEFADSVSPAKDRLRLACQHAPDRPTLEEHEVGMIPAGLVVGDLPLGPVLGREVGRLATVAIRVQANADAD